MDNSYKYFENRACQYYPCHELENINCLFCYCPLYGMVKCPGKFEYIRVDEQRSVKSCMNCDFPHRPENYEIIIKLLKGSIEDNTK